jgi:hypothetical protein
MGRNATSIGLALAVHAGALVLLGATHVQRVAPPREPVETELALDLTACDPAPPGTAAETELAGAARRRPDGAALAMAASRSATRPESVQGTTPESVDTRPAPDGTWSIWDAVATRPPMNLTLPAADSATPASSDETPPAPATVSTTGGLREGLAARDHELGLGPGGPVVGAAESATRASAAPVEGFALFEVRFDEAGAIHDVRVVDAKNERGSWASVAGGIAAGLASTHIRVPSGARGYAVKVRVESAWLYADGSRPGPIAVCVWPAPCNPDPKVKRIVVTPTPLMIAAGGNIVPDAPVAPSRQVHARIVEEHAY